jgi:hypothetical protein
MILKNWLKNMDLIFDVTIWGKDDEEPLYEGEAFNIPWTIVDYPIGRMNNDKEEPIYICLHKNKYGVNLPKVVINVIENDKKDEDDWF